MHDLTTLEVICGFAVSLAILAWRLSLRVKTARTTQPVTQPVNKLTKQGNKNSDLQ